VLAPALSTKGIGTNELHIVQQLKRSNTMKNKKHERHVRQLKMTMSTEHGDSSLPNLQISLSDSECHDGEDRSGEGLINRLIRCLAEIKKIQRGYEDLSETEYNDFPTVQVAGRPWDEHNQERTILRQRHVERRHQSLNHVLANLIEVVSHEVGLGRIDEILFPFNYCPADLFEESKPRG
jgi:hypothetical protein